LALDELPADWRARFAQLPGRRYAPDREAIRQRALMEPAPEYMIRLYDDFRTQILVAQ
jgi:putative spermidine/putrescine transport system substrate-binding protein